MRPQRCLGGGIPKDADNCQKFLAQGRQVYLEGLAPRMAGVERERDVDKWRDALTIYPEFKWDRELMDDKALRGYFEALRAEVRQRDIVPTSVPEKKGILKTYVDGVEHGAHQAVRSGSHLIQVECPDGSIHGKWTDFNEPPGWSSFRKVGMSRLLLTCAVQDCCLG